MLRDGIIYFFGGQDETGQRFANIAVLDPQSMEWKNVLTGRGLQTPPPRAHHAAAELHEKLLIFGGYSGNGNVCADLVCFDPGSLIWAPYAAGGPPPQGRFDHTMTRAGEHLVIVGGRDVKGPIEEVCILDIQCNSWSILPGLSNPMRPIDLYNHAAVAVKSALSWKVFTFGGVTGLMDYTDKIHCYDTKAEAWVLPPKSVMPNAQAMPPSELNAVVFDAIKARVLVLGGWANKWVSGVTSCVILDIVGPSYAVTGIQHALTLTLTQTLTRRCYERRSCESKYC